MQKLTDEAMRRAASHFYEFGTGRRPAKAGLSLMRVSPERSGGGARNKPKTFN